MENNTKGAGDDYPIIPQPIKADFTIPNDQFVAVQNAAMIRLTDGKLFIKKEAVIELMETEFNDLQKELASLKEENAKMKEQLEWKDRQIADLRESIKDNSPF